MSTTSLQGGWFIKPLIDVATLQRGYDLPVQHRIAGRFPIFAANGSVGFHDAAKCKGPGVVTGRSGTIGKVHFIEGDYWPLNTALYVKDFHGNQPRWIYYMLQCFGLERYSQGAGVPTLNRNLIHGELVKVPPIQEQHRIVAILNQADALRAKRREALAQLDSLTQSIFMEMFGDTRKNPKKWPTEGIGQVCELIVDCVNRTAPVLEEVTPYKMIRTTNVKAGKVDLSSVRYVSAETFEYWNRRATPTRGDVLLTREAPLGEAGILFSEDEVFLGQRLMLYRPREYKLTAEYLLYSFLSPFLQDQFDRYGSGSTVKHLPLPACRAFELRLPPFELQQTFSTRIQAVEALKTQHRAALTELDALFASLQHRAFQGEL